MKFKAEDVAFWILILVVIVIILWLLKGSPTLENAIISISLFIISSELMLWKKFFEVDKKATISFVRLKNDMDNLNREQKETNNKLDNIKKLIKK